MYSKGGGTWGEKIITGQVTDDTELAISLAYGLCEICDSITKEFDLQYIANQYYRWHISNPFDEGFCTREVLKFAPMVVDMKKRAKSYDAEKKYEFKSEGNLANGALMRCMPLILYGSNLKNYDNLYILMKMDAQLTHCNYYIFLVNTCYAIIAIYLLKSNPNEKDKGKNAYNEMYQWLSIQSTKEENPERSKAANNILHEWLKHVDGKDLNKLQNATKMKGFVKIAFQRVCYHLLNHSNYAEAIRSTVGEGGDADTNACIVGGIMGAFHGLSGIPKDYIENINNCTPSKQTRDRFQAKWYSKNQMIEKILLNAPIDKDFRYIQYST